MVSSNFKIRETARPRPLNITSLLAFSMDLHGFAWIIIESYTLVLFSASLFCRPYTECRSSDLDDFFSHENQLDPYLHYQILGRSAKERSQIPIRQSLKDDCDFDFSKEIPSASCLILN